MVEVQRYYAVYKKDGKPLWLSVAQRQCHKPVPSGKTGDEPPKSPRHLATLPHSSGLPCLLDQVVSQHISSRRS